MIARVIEEEMFGLDNLCWISAKATLEASMHAEFLILQSGMTSFGKAYYRKKHDLVPNVSASAYKSIFRVSCFVGRENSFILFS